MFQKDIAIGSVGKLSIKEDAGVASLEISVSENVGGGSAAGVLTAVASAKVEIEAKQLIDMGFGIAESKFPSVAPLLKAAQDAIDAELAKA